MSCSGGIKNVNIECGNLIRIDSETVIQNASQAKAQILNILKQWDCKLIIFLIFCNSLVIYCLRDWSASTDSLALRAYANTLVFNVCALAVCLISIWVEQNTLRDGSRRFAYSDDLHHHHHHHHHQLRPGKFVSELPRCKFNGKPLPQWLQSQPSCQSYTSRAADVDSGAASSISTLGLEKYEVLALLFSSCFSLIAGFLVVVDAIVRIREQPVIHEGRLIVGAVLGLVAHLVTILAYPDAGLSHVVCTALPCPTLKGVNPILGCNVMSFVILCGVHIVIHFGELHTVDTAATFAVIGLNVWSMLPLSFYTASIILQKLSHHMHEQLEKCLNEALIIDGVLEFRNERFWTKSFGKLAGSLEVRIRKNADEHYVLRKVVKRLSQVVSTLNVQEFREPISIPCNPWAKLPLDYYVDELLQTEAAIEKRNASEKELLQPVKKVEEQPVKNFKIEEILNCANSLAEGGTKQTELMQRGYASLLRNDEDYARPTKSYLFRQVPVRNALLLGSRCELDDLHCTTRLYCQS